MRRLVAALAILLVAGCGPEAPGVPARDGSAGLQLAGPLDGRQLAVSDGAPRLFIGNCEPALGPTTDVCVISRDLSGDVFVLAFKNPGALVSGVALPITDPGCATPADCDALEDVAVVDVQVGDARQRATGGRLTVQTIEEFTRYAGRIRAELPGGGTLTGEFDVIPRPD
jgi:hypothetical protein